MINRTGLSDYVRWSIMKICRLWNPNVHCKPSWLLSKAWINSDHFLFSLLSAQFSVNFNFKNRTRFTKSCFQQTDTNIYVTDLHFRITNDQSWVYTRSETSVASNKKCCHVTTVWYDTFSSFIHKHSSKKYYRICFNFVIIDGILNN